MLGKAIKNCWGLLLMLYLAMFAVQWFGWHLKKAEEKTVIVKANRVGIDCQLSDVEARVNKHGRLQFFCPLGRFWLPSISTPAAIPTFTYLIFSEAQIKAFHILNPQWDLAGKEKAKVQFQFH